MVQRLRLAFWAFIVILVVAVVSMPDRRRVIARRRSSARIRWRTTPTCTRSSVPASPDKVTLISNFIPLQLPASGPNFWKFDDNVLYEIMVDNNGDAVEDITFQFRFRTEMRNPNTFLYNTGADHLARRHRLERPAVLRRDPRRRPAPVRAHGRCWRRTCRRRRSTSASARCPNYDLVAAARDPDRSTTASGVCRPARRGLLRQPRRVRSAQRAAGRLQHAGLDGWPERPLDRASKCRSRC